MGGQPKAISGRRAARKMGENSYDLEGGGDGEMAFSDKSVRRGFIKKVYAIISVQLLLTFGCVVAFNQSYEIKGIFLQGHQPTTMYWVAFGVSAVGSLAIIIAMACVRTLRVTFPINFVLLALFTAAESVLVGQAAMMYDGEVVMIAMAATALLVIALTLFAFQTKIDFTMCGGILFCVLFVFVLFGLLMAILPLVYCGIGVLIFSIYLIYDTQMMMGGNHKYSISPEEYIFAAIAIYLDIINIFLYILRIVGAAKK